MKIVVLISANAEWRAVREILPGGLVQSTPLGGMMEMTIGEWQVTLFHGGWGKIAAAASTQYVIDRFQPDLLVNLGTCGGFEGHIQRGTILLVERTLVYDIFEQMGDSVEALAHYETELDLSWLPAGRLQEFQKGQHPVIRSLLVSADRDILPGDIPMLVERFGAVAADWESGAIVWVAKQNGVRCLILRGVTDLVSAEGGEAYGNIGLFHTQTHEIMKHLLESLPDWLSLIK